MDKLSRYTKTALGVFLMPAAPDTTVALWSVLR
jgi:hypothetical protein